DLEGARRYSHELLRVLVTGAARDTVIKEVKGYALSYLADIALRESDPVRAARLMGAALALQEDSELRPTAEDLVERDRLMERIRSTLGVEDFAHAWSEGRVMNLEEAVEYALGDVPEPAPKAAGER
ncbi:MAG: hypothetical protein M3281_01410, partial [Chloroflexota bacterium]|nr:hypothetical protein [Chloroflexota bacterium]